jgi:hypothetical protein
MELNIDKHALRLSHLSVMQQQRALKALAQKQRAYNKANKANAESAEANTYDWHRKVRLAHEARAYNLVRGFLKGIPYESIEQSLKESTMMPSLVVHHLSMNWMESNIDWVAFDLWLEGYTDD